MMETSLKHSLCYVPPPNTMLPTLLRHKRLLVIRGAETGGVTGERSNPEPLCPGGTLDNNNNNNNNNPSLYPLSERQLDASPTAPNDGFRAGCAQRATRHTTHDTETDPPQAVVSTRLPQGQQRGLGPGLNGSQRPTLTPGDRGVQGRKGAFVAERA